MSNQNIQRKNHRRQISTSFSKVADRYDLLNDVMSIGIHRLWKRYAIELSAPRPGQVILDIAGGTGDLAAKLSRAVGNEGQVFLADISSPMLQIGRKRFSNNKHASNIRYLQTDVENLPFEDNTFDCITIAMGLRNTPDKQQALTSMTRVLKPGGRLLVLEYSTPTHPLVKKLIDRYTQTVVPFVSKLLLNDSQPLQSLTESILTHPDQKALKHMMRKAGLEQVEYHNLTQGIVALHRGFKY
ncbi:bifunctional demethylmenaquinone methyltransferase/2-methoxy-6-polyprenyl-1,4-benzoquinol methylase [Gammaproteobacteria bacterium 45_16_T64]|nr:bifunctional demethylmenaquinone methyltransferase/2-methoxy-6-polyprenyl-1,4-benzoquinol methylase [Gammaproteobacteria bacterium 45_16_T64]